MLCGMALKNNIHPRPSLIDTTSETVASLFCCTASFQFRRMLNRELSHFGESKSGNQISRHILSTYMGTYLEK